MKTKRNAALVPSDRAEAPKARRRGVEGFTLLEVMISVAVLAILVGGVYSVLMSSQNFYSTGVTRQEIQDRVRRALTEMATDLRQASAGGGASITFGTSGTAGDETVTFSMCTGFAAGAPTWSTPVTFTTINGDGENDNGADDNHNKMVDERKIQRTQAGRPNRIVADNLKEGSLRFTRTLTGGLVDRITITFTLLGVDPQGRVIEAADSVTVDLRNP